MIGDGYLQPRLIPADPQRRSALTQQAAISSFAEVIAVSSWITKLSRLPASQAHLMGMVNVPVVPAGNGKLVFVLVPELELAYTGPEASEGPVFTMPHVSLPASGEVAENPPLIDLNLMVSLADEHWQQSVGGFQVKVCRNCLSFVVPPKFGSTPLGGAGGGPKSAAYGVAAIGGGADKLIVHGCGHGSLGTGCGCGGIVLSCAMPAPAKAAKATTARTEVRDFLMVLHLARRNICVSSSMVEAFVPHHSSIRSDAEC
jgi:hypothetical protein